MRSASIATLTLLTSLAATGGCSNSDGRIGSGASAGDAESGARAGSSSAQAGSVATGGEGAFVSPGTTGMGGTTDTGTPGTEAGSSGAGGFGGIAGSAAGIEGTGGTRGAVNGTASMSKGWLYTMGNKLYVSHGSDPGTVWVGRGVNVDDLFFCGYNYILSTPNAEALLKTEMEGLLRDWKPNFVRMSLGMASYPTTVSWLNDEAKYKSPMVNVIKAIGAHPNTYVLVALRSDVTMTGHDPGNKEPTGMPSDSVTTPNKALYPTGTDPVYVALVDTFARDSFVLFGLSNEPGGNAASEDTIAAAMSHAVTTIRNEEDRLGVPHHVISVQGSGYSGSVGFWAKKPLVQDNIVYEVHGYPPKTSAYTYDNIPVILGEYGTYDDSSSAAFFPGFYADLEAKHISNLAWDFDPYSNCYPDLLEITHDATALVPNAWGKVVQPYLIAHAAP